MDPRMTSQDVQAVAHWHREMSKSARQSAFNARMQAAEAARAGDHAKAMECTSRAQKNDQTAEEWGRSADEMEREAESRRVKPRAWPPEAMAVVREMLPDWDNE